MAAIVAPYLAQRRLELRGEQIVRPFSFGSAWSIMWVIAAMRMNGKRRASLTDSPRFALGISDSNGYSQPSGVGSFAGLQTATLATSFTGLTSTNGYHYQSGQDSGLGFGAAVKRNGTVTQTGTSKFLERLWEEAPADGAKTVFPIGVRFERTTPTTLRITGTVYDLTTPATLDEIRHAVFARNWTAALPILKVAASGNFDYTSITYMDELTHACLLWPAVTRWECGALYVRKEL